MRFCHFCRLDTETINEDCVECGLSKPYDVRKETMPRNNEVDPDDYSAGCVADIPSNDDYDDLDDEEEMDDDEYEEGSYFQQGWGADSVDLFCDEFEEE